MCPGRHEPIGTHSNPDRVSKTGTLTHTLSQSQPIQRSWMGAIHHTSRAGFETEG